jgi:hypothetical protein
MSGSISPGAIASDGTYLYVANNQTSILKIAISTGVYTEFASGFTSIRSMAYGNSTLYVLDNGTNLKSVNSAGTVSTITLSSLGQSLDGNEYGLTIKGDGTKLYTANNSTGDLYSFAINTRVLSIVSFSSSVAIPGVPSSLTNPKYLYCNGDNIYINDSTSTQVIYTVSISQNKIIDARTSESQNVSNITVFNNFPCYTDTNGNLIGYQNDSDMYSIDANASVNGPTFLVGTSSGLFVSNPGNNNILKITGDVSQNDTSAFTYVVFSISSSSSSSSGSSSSLGAGGGGDPYVTTFDNICYKLPVINAPIRYFQTMDHGKCLTVNAQLKTVESSDLAISNFHSLLKLKSTMSKKQYEAMARKSMDPETLSFFEKIHIQYGEEVLVLNVWNCTFEIVENKASFIPKIVDGKELLSKSTGHYNTGYTSKTLKFEFGATSVYLSVYDSPMVRSSIYITSNDTKTANGVIVNTLAEAAMRLSSLASTEAVSKVDSKKKKVIVETFADAEGVRTRNIVTYH